MPKIQQLPSPKGKHTQTPQIRPLTARLEALGRLLGKVAPVPSAWLTGATGGLTRATTQSNQSSSNLSLKTCEDYEELAQAWHKAMKWSDGLDSALAAMLASSMSTQFVGEQLWLKIIGPPSSGKTSLMEGLATAREWYLSRDTIRGFHSGYKLKEGEEQTEDKQPLADLVMGKTLGTKDGDTLLKAPNLKQILAEGRALYDKVSRTNYRNFVNKEYMGHRMTWHLAGTRALREIDESELGARFLDVVVMENIDDKFEREVGRRAAAQEARNMLMLSDGKPESQYPKELANAMALTGGYLDFLRTNALELAKAVYTDPELFDQFDQFGRFVAHMRARPSSDGEAEREFGARLSKQLTRLAISLAATLNKSEIDYEVVCRVHKIAMDTSRGHTLDLVRVLHSRPQGIEVRGLASLIQVSDEKLRLQLRFLRSIDVTETDTARKRWRVTPRFTKLYEEVTGV